ncbi:MAG: hypothetical protein DMF84_28355 [Acidobacteria bacterium]|nr:MAG: hypothetical protein DMF84_28355 [Acidobacteriota bacterium]
MSALPGDSIRRLGGRRLAALAGCIRPSQSIANIDRRGPLKYFLVSLLVGPSVTVVLAATREDERGDLRQIDLWSGGK